MSATPNNVRTWQRLAMNLTLWETYGIRLESPFLHLVGVAKRPVAFSDASSSFWPSNAPPAASQFNTCGVGSTSAPVALAFGTAKNPQQATAFLAGAEESIILATKSHTDFGEGASAGIGGRGSHDLSRWPASAEMGAASMHLVPPSTCHLDGTTVRLHYRKQPHCSAQAPAKSRKKHPLLAQEGWVQRCKLLEHRR
jgi:hypothetical protein